MRGHREGPKPFSQPFILGHDYAVARLSLKAVIMPLISLALPGGAWREFSISLGEGNDPLKIGEVLGAGIDFVIIAFVVYAIVSRFVKLPAK